MPSIPFSTPQPRTPQTPTPDNLSLTLTTDLSSTSLHKTNTTLLNPQIAAHTTNLTIADPYRSNLGAGLTWGRDLFGSLDMSSDGVAKWKDVFKKLANCRSFEVRRDVVWDGPDHAHSTSDRRLLASDVVTMLLEFVIEERRRIESFGVVMRERAKLQGEGKGEGEVVLTGIHLAPLKRKGFDSIWASVKMSKLEFTVSDPAQSEFAYTLLAKARSLRLLR
ncbi:hypothetical protein BDW74DRAFT_176590 [Aspergillus multicolor]|uniref:uncharacterized protein n=1 Tax=Aspergillus multicolor TaxID=41759 RepID=UPI003CCDD8CC